MLKFIQQCSCGTVNAKLLRPCLPYFRLQQVMAEVNDLEPASLIDMMGQLEVSFLTEHELAGIVGITFAHGS